MDNNCFTMHFITLNSQNLSEKDYTYLKFSVSINLHTASRIILLQQEKRRKKGRKAESIYGNFLTHSMYCC